MGAFELHEFAGPAALSLGADLLRLTQLLLLTRDDSAGFAAEIARFGLLFRLSFLASHCRLSALISVIVGRARLTPQICP